MTTETVLARPVRASTGTRTAAPVSHAQVRRGSTLAERLRRLDDYVLGKRNLLPPLASLRWWLYGVVWSVAFSASGLHGTAPLAIWLVGTLAFLLGGLAPAWERWRP